MFMCKNCHDENAHFGFFKSIGPCEGCGKTAACIDCHNMNCCPRKKEAGQED